MNDRISHFVRLALTLAGLVVSGCSVQRVAHLYPANDGVAQYGVLEGKFIAHGTGNGELQILMPDGELLKGEYSIVRGGSIGFGTIYGSVFGPTGAATGSASSSTYSVEGASQGSASAFGNHGTSVDCEFMNDNSSGHGRGACRSSRGGLWRLLY